MPTLEEKKIVIRLPSFHWRSLYSLRFLLVLAVLAATFFFTHWYRNIRPYLWIESARLEALSTALHSDVAGRIVEMGPQEGDRVYKGQTLFMLDRDLILAKQAQIKRSSESLHQQIETEKERIGKAMEAYLTASHDPDAVSSDHINRQLDVMNEAQEKTEMAFSKLGAIQSELSLVDLQLKKMTLTAPFDGVIVKRYQNPGAVVSFGDPVYMLCDPETVWVEAEIAETEIGKVSIGTLARVRLPAYPKQELMGKVSYIGATTLAKSSLISPAGQKEVVPVKISLEKPSFPLKPGLSAKVALRVR